MRRDDAALEALLAEHGKLLARVAATYERDPALREELLQEITLAVWRALPSFRGESAPRTFLARIAHHRAASHVARRARRREDPWSTLGARRAADDGDTEPSERPPLVAPVPSPEEEVLAAERGEELFRAMAALPLPQRQALSLVLEGFSHREIGEVLGMTENHVGVTVHRARGALRRALAQRGAR
jgi:RNA polymerase sigma-70 factor (ECF subfamily)